MKHYDYWWTGDNIELVDVDGIIYALHSWNGEEYLHCWKCLDKFTADPNDTHEYTLRPVYSEDEDGNFEIVDYEVYY